MGELSNINLNSKILTCTIRIVNCIQSDAVYEGWSNYDSGVTCI